MGSFPETYSDPMNHVGKIHGNEGFKRRSDRQPLRACVYFFYPCKLFDGEKSRITFVTHSTSREDSGLYPILKEFSPLKLQCCV